MTPTSDERRASRRWLPRLGPGILMAGAAIGVSHLVQATRAGAEYGMQLIGIVWLAHLLKYPFFEYGHRYAAATGESLLDGYARLGRGYVALFVAMIAVSSVITIAGVTFITAGLAETIAGAGLPPALWSALLLAACAVWLAVGRYAGLDRAMKWMMAALFVATLAAALIAAVRGPVAAPGFVAPGAFEPAAFAFLIALIGWMPAPIEGSVFQSLWLIADGDRAGARMTAREARTDFHVGYLLSIVVALAFLGLGALVMHGSGVTFSNSAAGFAGQLVDLYARTLGGWSRPLVAAAAVAAMLSTLLAILDAYPRALTAGISLLRSGAGPAQDDAAPRRAAGGRTYAWLLIAIAGGAIVIVQRFTGSLRGLIDLATTLAFLSAPLLGWLNHRLLTSKHTPAEARPGPVLVWLARAGIAFFTVFGAAWLWQRFFMQGAS
jgi:Mn2+/Fe2+ NRAMP family transporter